MSDEAESMLVDDNGNVYVLGFSTVKKNMRNRCLVKYDQSGKEEWRSLSDQAASKNIDKLSMAFDNEGNILVTGSSKILNNKSPTNMMIDCINDKGTLLWQTFYTRENTIPVASAIAIDDNGNIYATGYIMGTKGFFDYCTVKFSR